MAKTKEDLEMEPLGEAAESVRLISFAGGDRRFFDLLGDLYKLHRTRGQQYDGEQQFASIWQAAKMAGVTRTEHVASLVATKLSRLSYQLETFHDKRVLDDGLMDTILDGASYLLILYIAAVGDEQR